LRKLTVTLPLLAALAGATLASDSSAAKSVNILVLKEHGVGSAAQAQPHLDKLVAVAKDKNGWAAAEGKLVTSRDQAEKYIKSSSPSFGMVSLGAFLGMRKPHKMAVIGSVDVKGGGGRQYHLISKSAADLKGCKGKALASNHADDERFVNKVIADGAFKLADFTVEKTRRPVQTLKKVISGEATCALIDDAQLAELPHIDGSSGIKSIWKSKMLPAMPVVAFSGASEAERAKFKASLSEICSGAGKSSCDKVGIQALKPGDDSAYSAVIASYDK
jgi:hypothetical protein